MPIWRNEKLSELARQLTYSPAEKRALQLSAAIDLHPQICPDKSYPWEFILFRLTGFRPKERVDHPVPGPHLRADLAQFIEFLSDTLSIPTTAAKEPVLTLEEVTRQFAVSTKTIQRWRRQGLLAQRYVFPDGRRRLGFLASAVSHFSSTNADRIQKSATFKQLSDDEKARIIRYARRLSLRCQCCMKDISRRIAKRLRRSPETIRYTIRNHDREHPESAIFPKVADPIRDLDRALILSYFDQGLSVDCIAKRYCRTRSSIYRVVSQQKAEKLKALTITFTPNPLFDHPDADTILLQVLPAEALAKAQQTVSAGTNPKAHDPLIAREPRDLPPYLVEIFRQPVMPQELETDAFRRMNYLKAKAHRLQQRLHPLEATSSDISEIESLLVQATTLKNQLVQSNLRIAVHVARKHQRAGNYQELAELVSDATLWIMRSVERFDFARNVKFSTYASFAISKNFARDRDDRLTRRDSHLVTGQEDFLYQVGTRDHTSVTDQVDSLHAHAELLSVIELLPTRERKLLTAHYGLDQSQPPMSLADIGEKLGITKSRVRQLETRAFRKLRTLIEARRTPQLTPQ